ncbi:MAG: hypothetical protein GWO17_23015, partial [Gemmatimonadetes bacterium]|nr:hypothetical protein [Gemmatimonadota bacterium]
MGAPDDLFLSEGMTEEIIAQLAQVTDLKVISRTSVVALQDASLTLPEIADTLGVEHVLEGSVQRNEDRARITVQLIEAETDAHLWAESYTRELVDLFGVQEEIARRVTQALVATVPELRSVSPASRPENAAAYEAYLKGRQLLHRRTRDSLLAAMAAFRRSYGLDPEYAPAYASHAAALTLWVMWRYGGEIDHYQAFGQALALSDRALSLDPENPTGHAVRGLVFTFASAPDDEAE